MHVAKPALGKLITIIALAIIPTLLVWAPFFFRLSKFWNIPLRQDGMATIVSNYDGPLYILVAKTFYDKEALGVLWGNLPSEYFAAHFPLFPTVIKLFSVVTGYPYALLISTVLGSILALYFFNKLAREFMKENDAMLLTAIFSIFPARFLIVRSVGSPEPLFIGLILASVFYFHKKSFIWAGVFGALAQMTKSPGALLFASYFLYLMFPKLKRAAINSSHFLTLNHIKKFWGLMLIPFSLLITFIIYKIRMNDFFAYFHSGDNIHLFFPPFQVFNYSEPWVGTFWLEEIVFVYLLGAFAVINLVKKDQMLMAWVSGVFFASIIFVSHRDIMRYLLPAIPFFMISYSKVLLSKEFKLISALLIIPIYLYCLSFISQNTMPISNWSPFL